ncbi:HD-GYP domain-containing protein [Thiohalomonas denitrificans]|uniref:HD-GYP domain-containing protein n=1 Tax=Thiohalomonas denitrificans TaxID=415747 RepID=UPI001586E4B9|nr:HD-GYP domain-containing protein [Thiohalomonas denitrificans]
MLQLYFGAGLLFVTLAEWLGIHFQVADRIGIELFLLRGVFYITITAALWAWLLHVNRIRIQQLMERNRHHYEAVLKAYDSALTLKDTYTGGHGRRVALYAATIAEAMSLSEDELEQVYQAALLHDIGKIGIPDAILTKPGRLTECESAIICSHPDKGADILQGLPQLCELAPLVRHHHERWDGAGYPARLKGEAIPLGARIIAVADVFDAVTSDRSYRSASTAGQALALLREARGSHFDPAVIDCALAKEVARALETYMDLEIDALRWTNGSAVPSAKDSVAFMPRK